MLDRGIRNVESPPEDLLCGWRWRGGTRTAVAHNGEDATGLGSRRPHNGVWLHGGTQRRTGWRKTRRCAHGSATRTDERRWHTNGGACQHAAWS